ncbi:unnamed protein product [Rhizophagus irregularis]|nr:unnamed protein product [Rhizophagus irregularis]
MVRYRLSKKFTSRTYILPAADIAKFVGDGNVDLGITGQDMVEECEVSDKIDEIMELGLVICSVEAACALGLADGIVDLVETEKHESSRTAANPYLVSKITSRLKGVIAAKKYVLLNYNIIKEIILEKQQKLHQVVKLLRLVLLDDGNWVEVQSMVVKEESS